MEKSSENLQPAAPQPVRKRRVYLYVDGFNLYHRRLKGNGHLKWLCLRTLVGKFVFANDEISKVSYFTAEVDPGKPLSEKRDRQRKYCNALKAKGVEIIYGRFEERMRECRSRACTLKDQYVDMTEKMSDVNLAINIVRDYLTDFPEVICVLSADTDVIPALRMVREEAKRIQRKPPLLVALLPTDDKNQYYSRVANFGGVAKISQIQEEWLAKAQLPDDVAGFVRPADWAVLAPGAT